MILRGMRGQLADMLLAIGAIQFGSFRLKLHETQPGAPLSPIYINLRTPGHPTHPGPLNGRALELISKCMANLARDLRLRFDYIVGIPVAGDVLADELLRQFPYAKQLHLTKIDFADGSRQIGTIIEDDFMPNLSALLVDDVITKAGSKLEAFAACDAAGLNVRDVLTVIDRQQGGVAQLHEKFYRSYSVFTIYELLRHYVNVGTLNANKAAEVTRYLAGA